MNININENFENYHEDFLKGLSKREAAYAGAILVTGVAVYSIGLYLLGLPSQICTYLLIPFCLPIGVLGFYKNHGMTFIQWYRRMSEIHGSPPYVYKTEYLLEIEEGGSGEPEQKTAQDRKSTRLNSSHPTTSRMPSSA